jgi:hypothetical protein
VRIVLLVVLSDTGRADRWCLFMRIQTTCYEGAVKKRVVYELSVYDLPGVLGWLWDSPKMLSLISDLDKSRTVAVVATKDSWLGMAGQVYSLSKIGLLVTPMALQPKPVTCKKEVQVFDVPNADLQLISYSKYRKQYVAKVVKAYNLPKFLKRSEDNNTFLVNLFDGLKAQDCVIVLNSKGTAYDVRLLSDEQIK